MTQDLIKTPVRIEKRGEALYELLDADGEIVMIMANEVNVNRIANTLNVLSGKLSGDPNGTATKEERELWRHTAIVWADKVEKSSIALLDCFERDEDGAMWGSGYKVPAYEQAEGKTDNDRDKALYDLETLLGIGRNV